MSTVEPSGSASPDFRAVFESTARPLLLMAADAPRYTMVAVNKAHAAAFRTTPEALVGQSVLGVFGETLPPEVQAFVDAIRVSLERVIATGRSHQMGTMRYAVPGADGATDERFWSAINSPVRDKTGRVTYVVAAVQDVTGEVLERQSEEARSLLIKEVDHRARNALSVVQSFVRLTSAGSIDEFRDVLEGRVQALARAQTSLALRRWEGAVLHEIIEGELTLLAGSERFSIGGPRVILPAERVQAMSMAIHELATNARKYGSLSAPEGTVAVAWNTDDAMLHLLWIEEGASAVAAPTRQGFGARLIDQLARQHGGIIEYDWRSDGLRATLRLKLA